MDPLGFTDLPGEMGALIVYHACHGLFPLPACLGRSRIHTDPAQCVRRELGGAAESKVVTTLRRHYRLVLRLRRTCRQLRDAPWLPSDTTLFDWIQGLHKVLFPLKGYFLRALYPRAVTAASPAEDKCLALRIKLAQPEGSILGVTPVTQGHVLHTRRMGQIAAAARTNSAVQDVMLEHTHRRYHGWVSPHSAERFLVPLILHAKALAAQQAGKPRVVVPLALNMWSTHNKRSTPVLLEELDLVVLAPPAPDPTAPTWYRADTAVHFNVRARGDDRLHNLTYMLSHLVLLARRGKTLTGTSHRSLALLLAKEARVRRDRQKRNVTLKRRLRRAHGDALARNLTSSVAAQEELTE
jgi:hypothetical protein